MKFFGEDRMTEKCALPFILIPNWYANEKRCQCIISSTVLDGAATTDGSHHRRPHPSA
jgi:hypothetical protein